MKENSFLKKRLRGLKALIGKLSYVQGSIEDGKAPMHENPVRWFLELGTKAFKAFDREAYIYLIFPDGTIHSEYCETHGDRIRDAILRKFGSFSALPHKNDIAQEVAAYYNTICIRLVSVMIGCSSLHYPENITKEQFDGLTKFLAMFDEYNVNNPQYPDALLFKNPYNPDEEITDLNLLMNYFSVRFDDGDDPTSFSRSL